MIDQSRATPRLTSLLQRTGRLFLYATVLTALLLKGATGGIGLLLASAFAAVAMVLAGWRTPAGAAGRIYAHGVLLCLLLCGFALFQAMSWDGNPLAHPVWSQTRSLLAPGNWQSVSVAPGNTQAALFSLVLPFLVYLTGLSLFPTDRSALALWRFLAALGTLFALVGIAQLELAPDRFLFVLPKEYYQDSLTGSLVNRNTAGTLLGIAGLLIAATLLAPVSEGRDTRNERFSKRRPSWRVLALGLAFAATILALFLTKSRGALAASIVSYVVFAILALRPRMHAIKPGRQTVVFALLLAALTLGVTSFGAQALWRMEVRGVDAERLCVYRSTWSAFLDNWRFGTGLGTFTDVFPAYRDPDCVGVRSLWTRAHNVWLEGLLVFGIGFVPVCLFALTRLMATVRTGLRTRRRMRPFVAAGAAIVLLVVLHGFVDFSLQIPGLAVYAAAALAASTTLCLRRT